MTKTVPDMMLKVGIDVHLKISKTFDDLFSDNQDDISYVTICLMNSAADVCSLVQQQSPLLWQKNKNPSGAE